MIFGFSSKIAFRAGSSLANLSNRPADIACAFLTGIGSESVKIIIILVAQLEDLCAGVAATFEVVPSITEKIIVTAVLAEVETDDQSFEFVYCACLAFGCLGSVTTLFSKMDVDIGMTDSIARELEGVTLALYDGVDREKGLFENIQNAPERIKVTPSK